MAGSEPHVRPTIAGRAGPQAREHRRLPRHRPRRCADGRRHRAGGAQGARRRGREPRPGDHLRLRHLRREGRRCIRRHQRRAGGQGEGRRPLRARSCRPLFAEGKLHLSPGTGVTADDLAPADLDPQDESLAARGAVAAAAAFLGGGGGGRTAAISGAGTWLDRVAPWWADAGGGDVTEGGPDADAEVLFVAGKAGVIDHDVAAGVRARLVVPLTPIPVTAKAYAALSRAGTVLLPDAVSCAAPLLAVADPERRRSRRAGRRGRRPTSPARASTRGGPMVERRRGVPRLLAADAALRPTARLASRSGLRPAASLGTGRGPGRGPPGCASPGSSTRCSVSTECGFFTAAAVVGVARRRSPRRRTRRPAPPRGTGSARPGTKRVALEAEAQHRQPLGGAPLLHDGQVLGRAVDASGPACS